MSRIGCCVKTVKIGGHAICFYIEWEVVSSFREAQIHIEQTQHNIYRPLTALRYIDRFLYALTVAIECQ